jgi:hypothetical protein
MLFDLMEHRTSSIAAGGLVAGCMQPAIQTVSPAPSRLQKNRGTRLRWAEEEGVSVPSPECPRIFLPSLPHCLNRMHAATLLGGI